MQTLRMAVLLAVVPSVAPAQSAARQPLEGAWKVVEIVVTGERAENTSNPQPGLFIFGPKHYSMMWIRGAEPRSPYKAEVPTNEEKVKAFDSFTANTGTYDVSGSTLSVRPMVARSPNFMAGGSSKYEFRVEGSNLWLTEKSTDTRYRIGKDVVPPSRPPSETRLKLVRLE
jgi:lipocalin-like protein